MLRVAYKRNMFLKKLTGMLLEVFVNVESKKYKLRFFSSSNLNFNVTLYCIEIFQKHRHNIYTTV